MVEQSRETPAEHRSGEPVETKLLRIAAKAREERKLKFVNLYYLMNEELLLRCFRQLSEEKAAGVDKVTKEQYAENLEANNKELVSRLHRMAYRPQPVRRVYIPKAGSDKLRPLGIPCLEVLANVYLHYAVDLWFEKVYRKSCKGKAKLIRYADDLVVCFQNREDAMRFQAALVERLGKFGLEVEPTKTKVLEFGRDAERNARARGERPGTIEFLGFTHYCSRGKDGRRFRMKRVTSRKKFRAKLAVLKEWLKQMRVMPTMWILEKVGLKLRGHYAYYGVTDNYRGVARFYREVTKLVYKWLNRRSQRRSYKWAEFEEMLKRFPLPKPRVRVHLFYRSANDNLGSRVR